MPRSVLRVGGALLVGLALAACAVSVSPADRIALENRTDTPVAVHVNGGWVGTYPAGAVVNVPIRGHGGPPFRIEVRSPSGAILYELTLSAGDALAVAEGQSSMTTGSAVPCGWIELSYGITVLEGREPVAPQSPTGPCP